LSSNCARQSRDIENRLELLDKSPFIHGDIRPVELLEGVDACTRNLGVQCVRLFELTAVHGLIGAFDLDGDGGLASLDNVDRLVVTFDTGTAYGLVFIEKVKVNGKLTLYRVRQLP
jgi:hypothetical protein